MSADAEEEARKRIIDALKGPTVKITLEYEEHESIWRVPSILLQEQTQRFHQDYKDHNPEDPEDSDSEGLEDSDSDCHEDIGSKDFEASILGVPPALVELFIYFMFFGCLPEHALAYTQIELCIQAYMFGQAFDAIKFKNYVMVHLYKTFSLSSAAWKPFTWHEFSKYNRPKIRGSRVERLLEVMVLEHYHRTEYMQTSIDGSNWRRLVNVLGYKHDDVYDSLREQQVNRFGEAYRLVMTVSLETFLDQGLPWGIEE